MKPIIEFQNVSVIHDFETGMKVPDMKNLVIKAGENVAILGPNGSGKSTFMKLITRELYPEPEDTTVCRIYGEDKWDVFQLRSLLGIVTPYLQFKIAQEVTIFDTVLSGFFSSIGVPHEDYVTKEMKQKAEKNLSFLGIENLKERLITEVSTGEARLALIGRALAHDPKALVLDEPTSGLDFKAAHKFRKYLSKITKTGTSIIVVTHDLEDILPEITRVVLLDKGRIFKDGKPEEMLTDKNMSALYTADIKVIRGKQGYGVEFS
ncbi:MAG: ATP-binding cassette domain-containing protein [Candidatus Firestonebacteria bacterium]